MVKVLVPKGSDGGRAKAPSGRVLRDLDGWSLERMMKTAAGEYRLKSLERIKKKAMRSHEATSSQNKDKTVVDTLVPVPALKTVRPALSASFAKSLMSISSLAGDQRLLLKDRISQLRSLLWPDYVAAVSGQGYHVPKPGDFSDASTFDFMSYLQYTALNELLSEAEACSHENSIAQGLLPLLVYNQQATSAKDLVSSILQSLVEQGYAAKFRVLDRDDTPNALRCDLAIPATLWSSAALRRSNAACRNEFHLLATKAALYDQGLEIVDLDERFSSDGKLAFFFSLQPLPV